MVNIAGGKDTLKELEGRPEGEGEEGQNPPREFFWDSIILYVVYAILALTGVDVIFEFVRGTELQCFSPNVSVGDLQDYVNNFCSESVPVAQYFTVFMFIHGLTIGIPHYLWLNHYAGSFNFFFQRASSLERLRDEKTGRYPESNDTIIEQLESVFQTYERNRIYIFYLAKLALQWALTVASFVFGIVYFTDFEQRFPCPLSQNATLDEAWPFPDEQVICNFSALRLLELLRIVDLFLLAIVFLGLSFSLIWCFGTHSTELGGDSVAAFSFQSGLDPKFFPSQLALRGPRIRNDLDFMVMKLFRTDGGLGHVFKEVKVLMKIKRLDDEDKQKFDVYKQVQSTELVVHEELLDTDIKWQFKKGVYKSFQSFEMQRILCVPDSIRGAVLGFASRSPANEVATYLSFGSRSSGLANSLARTFRKVVWFNFTPFNEDSSDEETKPADDGEDTANKKINVYVKSTGVTTIACTEDVFNKDEDIQDLLKEALKIFVPDHGSDDWDGEVKESNFILVGPIDSKQRSTIVGRLLGEMMNPSREYVAGNALLLYIRPKKFGFSRVAESFQPYRPPIGFTPVLNHQVAVAKKDREVEWPPAAEQSVKHSGVKKASKGGENDLSVLVGDTHVTFGFSLYTNTGDEDEEEEVSSVADNERGVGGGDNEASNAGAVGGVETMITLEHHSEEEEEEVEMKLLT